MGHECSGGNWGLERDMTIEKLPAMRNGSRFSWSNNI